MIDERSDIYSLGAILYEVLTLHSPIDREGGFVAIVHRVTHGEITLPKKKAPERAQTGKIPAELAAVAMKALATMKADRYPSVDAFRKDIELFVEGRSVSAKQDTVREMAVKLVKRNKPVSIATAAALAVLLVVAGYFLKINYSARVLAENNHAAYLKEQEERIKQGRESLPSMLTAAKLLLEKRDFDAARGQVAAALNFDPAAPDFRNLRGQLALVAENFDEAKKDLTTYARHRPKDPLTQDLLEWLEGRKNHDTNGKLVLAQIFTRHQTYAMADGALKSLGKDAWSARAELLTLYRKRLDDKWPGSSEMLTVNQVAGTFHLNFVGVPWRHKISSLESLRGLPLTSLVFAKSSVRDLSPLQGMPLTELHLSECEAIRDLGPLKDLQLRSMNLSFCKEVRDLTPLNRMPLKNLNLHGCTALSDLSPLRGMQLEVLDLSHCIAVEDIGPLKGMPLVSLDLYNNPKIADLTPLEDCPLETLQLANGRVSDLKVLRKMKLKKLRIDFGKYDDLQPLKGMPLTYLNLTKSIHIDSLEPLKGMKLRNVYLAECKKIRDLSPLQGMPIEVLHIYDTGVTDLTPLKGMKLEEISFAPKAISKGLDVLRGMESLRRIVTPEGQFSPREFWNRFEKEEFK